jgi:hypothetical protein
MMVVLPRCWLCKHIAEEGKTRPNGEKYLPCAAFPDGIPDEILWNEVRHDDPYPGDHGIQFEPMANSPDGFWSDEELAIADSVWDEIAAEEEAAARARARLEAKQAAARARKQFDHGGGE